MIRKLTHIKGMKSRVKNTNQQNTVIMLIICGGPIGKGTVKTVEQGQNLNGSINKPIKTDNEQGKKTFYANRGNK